MRPTTAPLVLAIAALLPACLDNEEEITVHADGSLTIRVAAQGDPGDFASGAPLPAEGPWVAVDGASRRWLPVLADPARRGELDAVVVPEGEEFRLAVEATFTSAADVPTSFALAADPYAHTLPTRTASLAVREVAGKTVYVFERTYVGRPLFFGVEIDRVQGLVESLPDELIERAGDGEPLTRAEWERLLGVLDAMTAAGGEALVRESLRKIYEEGDASLALDARDRVVARVVDAMRALIDVDQALAWQARAQAGELADGEVSPLEDFDTRARSAARQALGLALDAEGVAWEVRNAVLFELESLIAGWDHSDDLRDESFRVAVTMPGTIVGGNFASREGARASWSFDGDALLGGSRTLRVVSVVE